MPSASPHFTRSHGKRSAGALVMSLVMSLVMALVMSLVMALAAALAVSACAVPPVDIGAACAGDDDCSRRTACIAGRCLPRAAGAGEGEGEGEAGEGEGEAGEGEGEGEGDAGVDGHPPLLWSMVLVGAPGAVVEGQLRATDVDTPANALTFALADDPEGLGADVAGSGAYTVPIGDAAAFVFVTVNDGDGGVDDGFIEVAPILPDPGTRFTFVATGAGARFSVDDNWSPPGPLPAGAVALVPDGADAIADVPLTFGDLIIASGAVLRVEQSLFVQAVLSGGTVLGGQLGDRIFVVGGGGSGRVAGQLGDVTIRASPSLPSALQARDVALEAVAAVGAGSELFVDGRFDLVSLGSFTQSGGVVLVEGNADFGGGPAFLDGGLTVFRGDVDATTVAASGGSVVVFDGGATQLVECNNFFFDVEQRATVDVSGSCASNGRWRVLDGARLDGDEALFGDVEVAAGGAVELARARVAGDAEISGGWSVAQLIVQTPGAVPPVPLQNLTFIDGAGATALDRDLTMSGELRLEGNTEVAVGANTVVCGSLFSAGRLFMQSGAARIVVQGTATVVPQVGNQFVAGRIELEGDTIDWLGATTAYGGANFTWSFEHAAATLSASTPSTVGHIEIVAGADVAFAAPGPAGLTVDRLTLAGRMSVPFGTIVTVTDLELLTADVDAIRCDGGTFTASDCGDADCDDFRCPPL